MIDWHEIFEYRNGFIYWRDRPEGCFTTTRAYRSWRTRFMGKKAGHITPRKYLMVVNPNGRTFAHRIIWEMHNGPIPKGLFIDHIDHNTLNNCIENLRVVTNRGNQMNSPLRRDNKSGVPGVRFDKRDKLWCVQVGNLKIGSFKLFDDAVAARKEHAIGFHPNHGLKRQVFDVKIDNANHIEGYDDE